MEAAKPAAKPTDTGEESDESVDGDCVNMLEWPGATPSQRNKYGSRMSPPYPGTACCGQAKMGQDAPPDAYTGPVDHYSDKAFYALPRTSKSGNTQCIWRPCRSWGNRHFQGDFAKDIASNADAIRACEEAERQYEHRNR